MMIQATPVGIVAIVLVATSVVSCMPVHTVSQSTLLERTKNWHEPKVAVWYYMGTKDGFQYFEFNDLGIHERYRVPASDCYIHESFPYTSDSKQWRVMPWGITARHHGLDPKNPLPLDPPK